MAAETALKTVQKQDALAVLGLSSAAKISLFYIKVSMPVPGLLP
jgi:hypothetical protein